MRALVILGLIALMAPALATPVGSPQIVDPTLDVTADPFAAVVGVPEPSIDIISVTFETQGADLYVRYRVANVSFAPLANSDRTYSTFFRTDTHDEVELSAARLGGSWSTFISCYDAQALTCQSRLQGDAGPIVNKSANEVVFHAPWESIGSAMSQTHASTSVVYCYCADLRPNFGMEDFAPNAGYGADYARP